MNHAKYNYLRLSVTDKCNFYCLYCKPLAHNQILRKKETLQFEEMAEIVKSLSCFGIKHLRITGGEPLIKKGLPQLLKMISSIEELECLSLTTNGYYLKGNARILKESGIKKINISLDSLRKDRFKKMTGVEGLDKVLGGIEEAKKYEFSNLKINTVLIRGFNDDEVIDFAKITLDSNIDVRFIECFSTNAGFSCPGDKLFSIPDVKKKIESSFGKLEFIDKDIFGGPASYYKIKGAKARIGFIPTVTGSFCNSCNRLRLTCSGRLYPCLHSDYYVDLKSPIRENRKKELEDCIREALYHKPRLNKYACKYDFCMSKIGG